MPVETELTYRLLLKPTGGFFLVFSDRTMVDIDMTAAEMRDLALLMLEHADHVDRRPRDVRRPGDASEPPQCQQ